MHNGFAAIICRYWRWAIVIGAMSIAGCAKIDWRGESLSDPLAEIGHTLRPITDSGEKFGASAKAREIEQNLGY